MIEVALYQSRIFDEEIEFILDAYSRDRLVGEAGACNFVNSSTGMVKIRSGEAIKVPLIMDEDFHGDFEVRASDPLTGTHFDTLKLKTDYME